MVLERGGTELGASTESNTLQGMLTYLRRAFGNVNKKVVDHFIRWGFKEGRKGH